jgi:hypothetical protein
MDEVKEVIEAGCLEIELLFIEFEWKMNQLFKEEQDD